MGIREVTGAHLLAKVLWVRQESPKDGQREGWPNSWTNELCPLPLLTLRQGAPVQGIWGPPLPPLSVHQLVVLKNVKNIVLNKPKL